MGSRPSLPGKRAVRVPLVEILVVVLLLGLLPVIAVPIFLKEERRAVDASIKLDLHAIATRLEALEQADAGQPAPVRFEPPRLTIGSQVVTLSDGNHPRIFLNDGDGICIQVSNPGGSDPVRGYVWKVDAGGPQPTGQTCAEYHIVVL